jgi:hypothetical protein
LGAAFRESFRGRGRAGGVRAAGGIGSLAGQRFWPPGGSASGQARPARLGAAKAGIATGAGLPSPAQHAQGAAVDVAEAHPGVMGDEQENAGVITQKVQAALYVGYQILETIC